MSRKRVERALATVLFSLFLAPIVTVAAPLVHPGDVLDVSVLNYAAVVDDSGDRLKGLNSDSVTVAGDGSISLPVIGAVRVAGHSTAQIARLIAQRLNEYVRDPSVSVRLLQQSQTIFLTGATTGTQPFLPDETLASSLGLLRDQLEKNLGASLTPFDKNGGTLLRSEIDLRKIVIERDGRRSAPINGEALLQSGRPGPALEPDDRLIFASKPVKVDVVGQVAAPGPTYLYPDQTLEEALQQAGGALGNASTADATLTRANTETALPLASAAVRSIAQNGDKITVHPAPHVTVIGQVPQPGELILKNGCTLLNALYEAGGPTKWANVKDIQVVHAGTRQTYNLVGLQHGDLSSNVSLSDGDVVYVPEGHKIDATLFFSSLFNAVGASYDAAHF